jgi:tetratricopeptide (TPR) repeat protein
MFLKRCDCLLKLEDYMGAAQETLKAIKVDSNFRVSYYRAMNCFLMLGDTKKVEEIIGKFRVLAPNIDSINKDQVPKLKKLIDLKEDIIDFAAANSSEKCLDKINDALEIAPADFSLIFLGLKFLVILKRFDDAELVNNRLCSLIKQQFNFLKALRCYYEGEFDSSLTQFDSISSKLQQKMKTFEEIHGKLKRIKKGIVEGEIRLMFLHHIALLMHCFRSLFSQLKQQPKLMWTKPQKFFNRA